MVNTLHAAGVIFKLESPSGTLLGTITIPAHWAERLRERTMIQFPLSSLSDYDTDEGVLLRCGMLAQSTGNYRDALMLFGITPEEFERLPGCAFMPGAAYLRSVAA